MILEVVGLPGVGKTHYSENLSREKMIKLSTKEKVNQKNFLALKHLSRRPLLTCKILIWTVRYHRGSLGLLKHKILFVLFRALAKEQVANRNMIIDDGILQYILAISDIELQEKDFKKMIHGVSISGRQVLIIESEEKERQKNIQKRKRFPRSKFGDEYLLEFNRVLALNYNKFKQVLVEQYGAKVITQD